MLGPELKRLPVPRPRPKSVYNDAQIKAVLGAARSIDPDVRADLSPRDLALPPRPAAG